MTPATLTVSADNQSKVFGQANPALMYSITNFVNRDTISVVSGTAGLTTTATTLSPVGSYPITMTQGTLSASNYSFKFMNGTMKIIKASTTTVPQNVTVPTGAASATLSATLSAVAPSSAVVNEGTVTFVVKNAAGKTVQTATSGTVAQGTASANLNTSSLPAGTYPITATYNPGSDFTTSNGTAVLTRN